MHNTDNIKNTYNDLLAALSTLSEEEQLGVYLMLLEASPAKKAVRSSSESVPHSDESEVES